jgi:hypothetical protein
VHVVLLRNPQSILCESIAGLASPARPIRRNWRRKPVVIGGRLSALVSLEHYQAAFQPLIYGVALAILLTFLLKETGTRRSAGA